jgi:Zn-dependent peptidase ImmA (M78 family)
LDEDEPSTEWHLSLAGSDEEIAASARVALLDQRGVELEGVVTAHGHLNFWTTALERTGVLVMSTARGKVATAEMRAFSLYFDVLPVVMVNGADSARGRLFSLLHEYAHLLLRTNGLCDTTTDFGATSPDRRIEARCNAIAAAILMPASEVLRRPEVQSRINQPETWTYDALRTAAAPFGVSAEAFLRRLVTLGRVSTAFYQTRRAEFLHAYEDDEARTRKTGGDWYRNTARDLGKGYVRQVADAHRRRVIDSYTAADYLNVKVSQIDRLAETATASKAG